MGARDLDLDWARKQREGRNNKKSDRYNQKERKSTDRTTAVGRGWGAETEGQAIVAYSKLQCSCQWSGLARHSGGCWRGFTTTNLLALTFYLFKMTLWWYYPNDVLANIYSMPSRDEIQLKTVEELWDSSAYTRFQVWTVSRNGHRDVFPSAFEIQQLTNCNHTAWIY